MASRSNFPTSIDTFIEHFEIQASDIPNVQRYQELKLKSNRTPSEDIELNNLTTLLRDKIITAEDWNKFQDSLTAMQIFIKDNVQGYIDDLHSDLTTEQTNAIATVQQSKDDALIAIEQKKNNVIAYLDGTTAGELRNDIGDMSLSVVTGDSLIEKTNNIDNKIGILSGLSTQEKSNLVGAINEVNSEISTNNIQPVTLSRGIQTISSDQDTPLWMKKIVGRTLVNLFGRDGRLDRIGVSGLTCITETLIQSDKVVGDGSIEITATSDNNEHYLSIGGLNKKHPIKVNTNYYVGGYVKPVVGKVKVRVLVFSDTGSVLMDTSTTIVSDTTKWTYRGVKIPGFSNAKNVEIRCQIFNVSDNNIFVGSGEKIRANGISFYEITSSEYNKIDVDPDWSLDARARKYPYVDDVKGLQGAYAEVVGKNLLPPFNEWTLHTDASIVSQYEIKITNYNNPIKTEVPVIPNASYVSSIFGRRVSGSGAPKIKITSISKIGQETQLNDSFLGTASDYGIATSFSFTAPSDSEKVRIELYSNNNGEYGFKEPQLELGTVATPFEAQRKQYVSLPTTLHSSNDASDEYDGRVLKRIFKEITMDGSLPWTYNTDFPGFKLVRFALSDGLKNKLACVKYDGKILSQDKVGSEADSYGHDGSGIVISISDTDSGWSEGWTGGTFDVATYTGLSRSATASDMIKAYMNGWKWNSSGTGSWSPIIVYEGATTSTNVDYVVNNRYLYPSNINWQPYKLIYQLAEPDIEEIPLIGDVMLSEGSNSVTVGEGLVQREAIIAKRSSNNSNWYINEKSYTTYAEDSPLQYKAKDILAVRKGETSLPFTKVYSSINQNGDVIAVVNSADYDGTTPLYIDYIIESPLSSNAQTIDAEYSKNARSTLNELVRSEAEHGQRISVIEQTYARKAQPGWIAFILLNGVTAYNATSFPLEFRKDEFGKVKIKGLFTGVSSGLTIGYLPKGYRPKNTELFTVATRSGTTYANAVISISVEGAVQFFGTPGTTYNSLHGIEFYAEQ